MRNCDHVLIPVPLPDSATPMDGGVRVVCPYCGHVRIVWHDGTIDVIKENGEIRHKKIS